MLNNYQSIIYFHLLNSFNYLQSIFFLSVIVQSLISIFSSLKLFHLADQSQKYILYFTYHNLISINHTSIKIIIHYFISVSCIFDLNFIITLHNFGSFVIMLTLLQNMLIGFKFLNYFLLFYLLTFVSNYFQNICHC